MDVSLNRLNACHRMKSWYHLVTLKYFEVQKRIVMELEDLALLTLWTWISKLNSRIIIPLSKWLVTTTDIICLWLGEWIYFFLGCECDQINRLPTKSLGPLSFVMLIQVHHQYELTRNWSSHSISRISGVPMPSMPFYAPHAAADKVCCPYCNAARSVKNSLVPLSWRMVGTDGTVSWWHLFFSRLFLGVLQVPQPLFLPFSWLRLWFSSADQ